MHVKEPDLVVKEIIKLFDRQNTDEYREWIIVRRSESKDAKSVQKILLSLLVLP